jgi:hypothetical protein
VNRLRTRSRTLASPRVTLRWPTALTWTLPVFLLMLVPAFAAGSPSVAVAASSQIQPTHAAVNVTCNPNYIGNAAVEISAKNLGSVHAGQLLNISYQIGSPHLKAKQKGLPVEVPTMTAVFPNVSSGSLKEVVPPATIFLNKSGWNTAEIRTSSLRVPANSTFSTARAYLSSSKLAFLVNATSGTLTLQVRWHWSVYDPVNGTTRSSGWTVPSNSSTSPYLPSTFYPADWVGVVATSNLTEPSGASFNMTVDGAVTSTVFRVVLEYPNNGTEIQSIYENTPAKGKLFNATVPLMFTNFTGVLPGHYLVHLHDRCNAILHLFQVTVVAASSSGGGGGGGIARAPTSRP